MRIKKRVFLSIVPRVPPGEHKRPSLLRHLRTHLEMRKEKRRSILAEEARVCWALVHPRECRAITILRAAWLRQETGGSKPSGEKNHQVSKNHALVIP